MKQAVPVVTVVGSVHMDLVAAADRLPRRGETLLGRSFATYPGGKAGNQAIQVALHRVTSYLVGRVGTDAVGRDLRSALVAKGVDETYLADDPARPTGVSAVLTGEGGDYASVIVPGASLGLDEADIARASAAIDASAVVLTQLEARPAVAIAALGEGRRRQCRTILNAAPAPEAADRVPPELWRVVDVLLVNRVEAATLGGHPLDDLADAEPVAEAIARRYGVATVIVTLGPDGALVWDKETRRLISGEPVAVVDTIGAGDAFAGTLAAGLAKGQNLFEAVRLANAAGALAVTRAGAYDAMPTAGEIERFLADRPCSRTG